MSVPKVGDRISEYVLTAPLGSGGFGQVFKAVHHIWRDRVVAVKIPTDTEYVRILRHEGVTLHELNHPNIVAALGLDPFADPPYFIMEYVAGRSLRERMCNRSGGLSVSDVRVVMTGTLRALEHAHASGIIHRDIKPENILIAERSGGMDVADVRVTDFGLGRARQITAQSMIQSGSLDSEMGRGVSGTLAYMAPEQRDGGEADARADLYSLGVVLFEMICGERPGGVEMPGSIRPGLPEWVDRMFARLYARWDRRFGSASAALEALDDTAGRLRACQVCRKTAEESDRFCICCGSPLTAVVPRCVRCRGELEQDDRFCIFCGTSCEAAVA